MNNKNILVVIVVIVIIVAGILLYKTSISPTSTNNEIKSIDFTWSLPVSNWSIQIEPPF